MKTYDVIVLGGGSAGYAAARTAVDGGATVAVVDGGNDIGGLCILRGCMPTKALLESAHRLHEIQRAREFGLTVQGGKADWGKVVARKDQLIGDFSSYRKEQLEAGKFDFYRGLGRFLDAHTIQVDTWNGEGAEAKIRGKAIIIATGSVVAVRDIPGLSETGFMTSDEAIRVKKPLKSLIVLGGGAIAAEFAQYFAYMGAKVKMIQRSPRILRDFDDDVADVIGSRFIKDGIQLETGTSLQKVAKAGRLKKVFFEQGGETKSVTGQEILYALGRKPAVGGLNLDAAGVKLKDGYVKCDLRMRTSQKHIFGAGDVSGPFEVVHINIQQGETAAKNALRFLKGKKLNVKMDYRLKMAVVFTEPEVAVVGMTEKEAKAEGIAYRVAKYPFDDHGKSMIMGAVEGFVKVLADPKKGRILGAQIVGPRASDMIHQFTAMMHYKGTVEDLMNLPHYHPTVAEIFTYPAEELFEEISS